MISCFTESETKESDTKESETKESGGLVLGKTEKYFESRIGTVSVKRGPAPFNLESFKRFKSVSPPVTSTPTENQFTSIPVSTSAIDPILAGKTQKPPKGETKASKDSSRSKDGSKSLKDASKSSKDTSKASKDASKTDAVKASKDASEDSSKAILQSSVLSDQVVPVSAVPIVRLPLRLQSEIMVRRLESRLTPLTDVDSPISSDFSTVYTYLTKRKNENTNDLSIELVKLHNLYAELMRLATFASFDQENHVYSVLDVESNKWIPLHFSVTKALELIFDAFDADLVAKRVVESQRWKKNALYAQLNFDEAGNARDSKTVQTLLKNHWKMKRDKGTALHEYIQSHSRGQGTNFMFQPLSSIVDSPAPFVEPYCGVSQPNSPTDSTVDRENILAFERFTKQRERNGWLLLASEYVVYSKEASIGGCIDAVFVPYPSRPDLIILVDWKRCEIDYGTRYSPLNPNMRYEHPYTISFPKCNYWKYAFQLNIYRELFERMFGVIVIDMLIVSFPENSEFPRVHAVPKLHDAQLFIDDLIECNKTAE